MAFSTIVSLVLVILGGLLIISIVAYIFKGFTDPNKVEDGIMCRITIQTTNRLTELSQGFIHDQITESCQLIKKTIPMQKNYPSRGGYVRKMDSDQFREVVMFDLAKLINNAWWITGEGDRAEYMIKNWDKIINSENKCFVVYAVRIDPPRKAEFMGISENDLGNELMKITRSDISQSAKADKRSIMAYLTFDGKGSGVFVRAKGFKGKDEKENDRGIRKIDSQERGSDAIYGIAVGFEDSSGISKVWKTLIGKKIENINDEASFIYIAPFNQLKTMCKVIE